MKKTTRRTLERQIARELSTKELEKALGGRIGIETISCCGGCADD